MGHKDIEKLYQIYQEIQRLNKKHNWTYQFKMDSGDFETRIDIDTDGDWRKGDGRLPQDGYEIWCPDLIDFDAMIIIEYEEEAKKHSGFFGSKLHKGHFEELENPRDQERNLYYQMAKFHQLKIYERQMKDGTWKMLVYLFLDQVKKVKEHIGIDN